MHLKELLVVLTLKDIRRMTDKDLGNLKSRSKRWFDEKPDTWGLPTGIHTLDKITGGLVRGEIITLAGGPGSGKTSLGMQMVENTAAWMLENHQPYTNVVISAEMSRSGLYMRSACRRAKVDSMKLRTGDISQADLDRFFAELDALQHLPLLVLDQPGMTSTDVRNALQMLTSEGLTIGVCAVDYIQRLADVGDNVNVRVTNIMQQLGTAMLESECCMLCLSQYSRAKEREKRPPQLTDLRDSGSIEQDSYQVWALHDPDPDIRFTSPLLKRDLFVLKNRNGQLGHVRFDFHPALTEFTLPPKAA